MFFCQQAGYYFFNFSSSQLICAFSSRKLGNMSLFYADKDKALENRKNFLSSLGINYLDLVCIRQIHQSNIKYVKLEDKGRGALSYKEAISDTDAFFTDQRYLPLAIFTADCLSIFIYEPKIPLIGLVHAGWRSTKDKILTKTLEKMQKEFNINIKNLYVAFGPAIRSCCYEVGKEFLDYFSSYVIKKDKGYYLDLMGINKRQLLDYGIEEKNLFDCQICTFCQNNEFFSYRKEGNASGRIMSVMMLK